jgi:UDP-glucuronate decarboxylase
MKQKTILVTGGAGFIGSHLVKKYIGEGHRVIVLDNLQTTGDAKNIKQFFSHPHFVFKKHDIIKPISLREHVDWIFNLACAGSYTSYQWNPVHTMKTNTMGMIQVLEYARKHGARVLQTSTSEIYGDPEEVPQKETYRGNVNTLGPRACYDEGKRAAETLCMDYRREYGVDARIVRIFNTFGPCMDQNDGRVVTNFILNALEGKELVIYGNGSHTRSFQYIDDLVEGIDRMMRLDEIAEPVNLGNPGEVTMRELAEKVITLTESSSNIIYEEGATDDPKRRCPDISRAQAVLGWNPRVSLDEGLKKTVAYFTKIERPQKKVLVFSTTFIPTAGPAENTLYALMGEMPSTEFFVITSRLKRSVAQYEQIGSVHIFRVGFGTRFDKYVLPIFGLVRACALTRKKSFVFVWSVMASYAGVLGVLYHICFPRSLFFVTLDDEEIKRQKNFLKKCIAGCVVRMAQGVSVSDMARLAGMFLATKKMCVYERSGNPQSFAKQVQGMYVHALNMRDKKLARPK